MFRPTIAEIDLGAIRDNIAAIRQFIGPKTRIMSVVKADGYGHGAVAVGKTVVEAGADALGVATLEEAIELRESGITCTILILSCVTPECAGEIVHRNISAAVSDIGLARLLSKEAVRQEKRVAVHVKIDTGLGRLGFSPSEAPASVQEIAAMPQITMQGVFTHFSCADEQDDDCTIEQTSIFADVVKTIRGSGIDCGLAHAANSGATLNYPEARFDMVRPGIIIYGLHPSTKCSRNIDLHPAMTVRSKIVHLKRVECGSCVSYGRTFEACRPTVVATTPMGYADGYSRKLSNLGVTVVKGMRAPVIGRVCMDMMMLDVTDIPGVAVGDEVVVLGGKSEHTAIEKVAQMIDAIPYEITCGIGKRAPRTYIGESGSKQISG